MILPGVLGSSVLSSPPGILRKLDMLSFEVTSVSFTNRNSCEQKNIAVIGKHLGWEKDETVY